jgi:putative phosphoesterase
MKIAVLSDSHDHIPNLARAVSLAGEAGAELLIHCGDLISPFMLPYLHRFKGPIHLIYGNNMGDQHLISTRAGSMFSRITHHGILMELTVDGFRIGCHHYPELARGLAASGSYDLVCCGHNHEAGAEWVGSCLLLNPGDLLGKDEAPGFMLLDSGNMNWERIIVGKRLLIDGQ